MTRIKRIIYATTTLCGAIIGVGIFSLPYIALKVGFWAMIFYFLTLGSLVAIVHLFLGELSLRAPDYKRLPGFVEFYLGKKIKKIAYFTTIFGSLGALLAYLIVGGEFLYDLFSPSLGGDYPFYILIYFIIGSVLIYFDIGAISKITFWGLIAFFIILIGMFFYNYQLINVSNFFNHTNLKFIFLPYGAILFSLWGGSIIPEIEEMLKEDKKALKKVILISIVASAMVYIAFICLILGISGADTTPSAIGGIRGFVGEKVIFLAYIFGFLAIFTSFISVGLTLKKIFWYDLKIEKKTSWAIACFAPLALYFLGFKDFILVISFFGGVMLGIEGILILLMHKKIEPRKIIVYPLILIFILGIIYEIKYFLNNPS